MCSINSKTTFYSVLVLSVCLLVLPVDSFGGIHGFVGSRKNGPPIALRMAEQEGPIGGDGDGSDSSGATTTTTTTSGNGDGRPRFPVEKTDDEWKELLTPDQYYILRREGTETPGASALNKISVEKNGPADEGTFCCAGCGNPLFLASAKYESGTGWPSFYRPLTGSAVGLLTDYKLVVPRTECVCSRCGGHLGHVFEDGPEPTGQRYCMNGAAMRFYRDSESPELAEKAAAMALEDPYKLSAAQTLPSVLINVLISGIFLNAFLSSGKATPIEYLTLLPAAYYGFLAARSITKIIG